MSKTLGKYYIVCAALALGIAVLSAQIYSLLQKERAPQPQATQLLPELPPLTFGDQQLILPAFGRGEPSVVPLPHKR